MDQDYLGYGMVSLVGCWDKTKLNEHRKTGVFSLLEYASIVGPDCSANTWRMGLQNESAVTICKTDILNTDDNVSNYMPESLPFCRSCTFACNSGYRVCIHTPGVSFNNSDS